MDIPSLCFHCRVTKAAQDNSKKKCSQQNLICFPLGIVLIFCLYFMSLLRLLRYWDLKF